MCEGTVYQQDTFIGFLYRCSGRTYQSVYIAYWWHPVGADDRRGKGR
jgi:hypothetical protein